uniref:Uncharacterized protein n=1 Tax=Paenibacillus athensensis TaxID=1967502 RepID=A0A4Y8PRH1_9BACL
MKSRVCGLPSAVCGLRSAVCDLPSAICDLRSALCGLRSAVCGLPSAVCSRQSRTAFMSLSRGTTAIKGAFRKISFADLRTLLFIVNLQPVPHVQRKF